MNSQRPAWRPPWLISYLANMFQMEQITSANYWSLIWPGFVGQPRPLWSLYLPLIQRSND